MGLQILLDRLTQYTIAFSMDKDNLLSVIKSVLIHHLTEFSQLVRQHIRIAQSIRIIQQFGYMQIDLKDSYSSASFSRFAGEPYVPHEPFAA